MKANPGGQLNPREVIGRDRLIRNLWRVLETRSLVLSAERRMGKTCIIKKMTAEASPSKLPIYRDLEGIRTPIEFVETLYRDVETYLRKIQRMANRVRAFLNHLGGAEIGSLFKFPPISAPHWKALLTNTVEDLVEYQDRDVILFWDEMPLMLFNVRQSAGETVAMELLDVLRSLRQQHLRLRMVFTGSVGLHNVISALKRAGYANDPTNDMDRVDVPPLEMKDATQLAKLLLEGENLTALPEVATLIAEAVDGVPYFIHHVVDQLAQMEGVIDGPSVSRVVSASLTDPHDRWHMGYYSDRLNVYYSPQEQKLALLTLDVLAFESRALPFNELFNLVKSRLVTEDAEACRQLLQLLQEDHYLVRDDQGRYLFRFELVKRWWKQSRGTA
jgi:hypothetical protein